MLPPITVLPAIHALAVALLLQVTGVVRSDTINATSVGALSWLSALADTPLTYLLLGASAIVTEELGPIVGGMAVHEGELRALPVLMSITLGGWIATAVLYLLGRWKWEAIRRRFPRVRSTGTLALRAVRRNQLISSFFVRFAFGLRIVLPIACGAARVPLYIYLPLSLVGSAIWTAAFVTVGYATGEAAVRILGDLGRGGKIIGAVVTLALVIVGARWQRGRNERKLARRAAVLPFE